MAMMDKRLVFIDTVAERLKEKSDYIEQFKENKELNNHSLRAQRSCKAQLIHRAE